MNSKKLVLSSVVALAAIAGSIALAQPSKEPKSTTPAKITQPAKKAMEGMPEGMQLPPGWTSEDMQACMVAGTPGEHHKAMMKSVGTWDGKNEFWMAPGMPGMKSESVTEITSLMDGRYVQIDSKGEMPGMGAFHGLGVSGYDNVSGKYVSTWIDNMGTGIMTGTGEMSADGKTLTTTYTFNCPINKKPAIMREVQTFNSDTSMTLEMFGNDPKSGKEFKMMRMEYTKRK